MNQYLHLLILHFLSCEKSEKHLNIMDVAVFYVTDFGVKMSL